MMYGWQYQGMDSGWWFLMAIAMVIFWAVLIVGVVALLRHNRPVAPPASATIPTHNASPSASNAAIAILQERFARGELTEEEYTRRREILKETS